MKLKWSRFIFWVESYNKEEIIGRNTLTTTTIRMKNRVKKTIDSIIYNEKEIKTLSKPIQRYLDQLVSLEMLVPVEIDEGEKYLKLFHKARRDDKTFGIYLVTTRACQLDCPYCFERGIRRNKSMSVEMAKNIVTWTKQYLDSHVDCDKLRVVLYGGEPLLNKKVIRYILPELYKIAKDGNLQFEHGILTNGELLDLQTLSFLIRYNLDRVQITLDGPRDAHDKRRVRKDGRRTFDKIVKNILLAFQQNLVKKIYLRINFDKQNIDSIPALLDFFVKYNLQEKIELSFGIITPTICKDSGQKVANNYFEQFGLTSDENSVKYLWLSKEAKKRGFIVPQEYLTGPWCTARKIHSTVIEPDGTFLKCISFVGRESFSYGDVFSTSDTYDSNFNNFSYLDECLSKKCPFIPICGGGCRFESYITSGSLVKSYCRKKMIEKINKGLIRLHFQ